MIMGGRLIVIFGMASEGRVWGLESGRGKGEGAGNVRTDYFFDGGVAADGDGVVVL
ncbi:MAG: hypothetical protein ACJA16_000090 [Akkermansiaceae bacterium]|jgi:hypothetical protein